jgi:prophage tail gpP-like protein
MAFDPTEIAVLIVNGAEYRDWKTVLVHKQIWSPYNYFRFTTSEGEQRAEKPITEAEPAQRIRPGESCSIILAGRPAISGIITTRQVAYAAQQHTVELIGKTDAYKLTKGAANHKDGEFTDITFPELAQKITAPFGVTYKHIGGLNDKTKIPRVTLGGQTAWQILEEHARTAGVVLGPQPTARGDILQGAPPDYADGFDAVIEGVNILEGREIVSVESGTGGPQMPKFQSEPTDAKHGAEAAFKGFASKLGDMAGQFGVKGMYMPISGMGEIAGGKEDAAARAAMENYARAIETWVVEIVVQGWLTRGGQLWQPWMDVYVKSPMLILDRTLHCKSVTFTQDDRTGSRTLLELHSHLLAGPGGQ